MIGAGFVGIATALYLQRDGWRVTIADPNAPGDGASKGNGGLFAICNVTPLAFPGILKRIPAMLASPMAPLAIHWAYLPRLAPWLARFMGNCSRQRAERASAALSGLLGDSLDAYAPLLASAGAEPMVKRQGVLYLHRTEESFVRAKDMLEMRRRHGVKAEVLGSEDVRRLIPALAPNLGPGVLYPDVCHAVNPLRLLEALARDFAAKGGVLLRAAVTGFEARPDGLSAVETTAGKHEADVAVLAAGAWSKRLAARLGAKVPLDTERGYHVTVGNPGVELGLPVIFSDYAFAATPMEMGLRFAGTIEFAGLERLPNPRRVAFILAGARELFPDIDLSSHSTWMGCRPSMPDSLPVIGPAPRCRQVFFAFGHGHVGMTAAAATGRAIADAIAGRKPRFDLGPFAADRFD